MRATIESMNMQQAKSAFLWIIAILNKHNIQFQITGGLAARIYGASRELADIDIDIPEDKFDLVKQEVAEFINYGPAHFKSEQWDLLLMTLDYKGQLIDLSGAHQTKVFDNQNQV